MLGPENQRPVDEGLILLYRNPMGMWRTEDQRTVYQNPWITVREDSVVFPNGKKGIYGVVSMPDTVAVVARRRTTICLVRQYRYTIRKYSWELPSGHVHRGESPLRAAKRELQEEAGFFASHWKSLGYVHPALGILSSRRYIFLATGLRSAGTRHEDSESDMLIRWFGVSEIEERIRKNEIFDDYLLAALYKLNTKRA